MEKYREETENKLIERFTEFGRKIGFTKTVVKRDTYSTDIYIINDFIALQMELDYWRAFDMYMYLVNTIDGKIPDKHVIYKYDDGTRCREYIEVVYKIKNPIYSEYAKKKNEEKRYTEEFLYRLLDFYEDLIRSEPQVLYDEIQKF